MTYPALEAVWAGQQEVVSDAEEELGDETFDHLVDEEEDVLGARTLNLHHQLLVAR